MRASFSLVFTFKGDEDFCIGVARACFFILAVSLLIRGFSLQSAFLFLAELGRGSVLVLKMVVKRRAALKGSHVDYYFVPDRKIRRDLDLSISQVHPALYKFLKRELRAVRRGLGLRLQLRIQLDLEKFSYENEKVIRVSVWFPSDSKSVMTLPQLHKQLQSMIQESYGRYDAFVERGSGWILKSVKQLSLSVTKYKLFRGGCVGVRLPHSLRRRKCCFSVAFPRNKEGLCFFYAIAGSLARLKRNRTRNCQLYERMVEKMREMLPSKDYVQLPVTAKDIKFFEVNTPISVNVYGFDGVVFPYYLSDFPNREPRVDILLYNNHYFSISSLSCLVGPQLKVNRRKSYVCQFCLTCFASLKSFNLHKGLCRRDGSQYELPPPKDSNLSFTNYKNMLTAPFVIYCDMETMIQKEIRRNKGKILSSRRHVPAAVGALTVCRPRAEFGSPPFIHTGPGCVDALLSFLFSEVRRAEMICSSVYEHCHMTKKDIVAHRRAERCEMCGVRFSLEVGKVRDHCHLSGQYRMALCSTCNLTRAKLPFAVYVFFHGLSNYDSHFIVQRLSQFDCKQIRVIPRNTERYLSFSLGPIHFKDSYQFLGESLATLSANLSHKGEDCFKQVNRWIEDPECRRLLKCKGIFPYSYFTDWSVLNETELPPIDCFKNDLDGSELSTEDYAFALRVWEGFGCVTFKDYMEIYLKADCLLLADCFETFRDNCQTDYSLDPVHYFSSPHFTFEAFLWHSRVSFELLTDLNQYLFISRGIRGGLSMVSKRYSKANNKYLSDFDPDSESIFIVDLDANNLYGFAMQQFLPVSDFTWMERAELELQEILTIPCDSPVGCIVEVTLSYPPEIHDSHSDYPFAPEKVKMSYAQLSPLAKAICDKHRLKSSTNVEKLLATFRRKERYVLHYRLLQLYVTHGMLVEEIHAGIRFTQAPVMRSYVDLNSRKRAAATNKFDTDFYKLLSNSLYGKTIENPEKRCQIRLCNSSVELEKTVSRYNFKRSKIINSHLVGVEMKQPRVKLNKPFYVGMSILDLAKFFMYDFQYNVMKPIFGRRLSLLYTDTDSFLYEIKTPDFYSEIRPVKHYFDFSNYPKDHPLYSEENKRVPGMFKDECGSKMIKEFVGLRSKMYSLRFDYNSEVSKVEQNVAKGVKSSVIARDLRFDHYLNCLKENEVMEHSFKNIRSLSHRVFTLHQSKISLSPFEDKRYLLDAVHSVPYGHYAIT